MSRYRSAESFFQAIACCEKIQSTLASIGGAVTPGTKITIMIPKDVLEDINLFRTQLVTEYPFLKKDSSIVLFPQTVKSKDGNWSFSIHFDVPFEEFKEKPKPVEPKKFDLSALFTKE